MIYMYNSIIFQDNSLTHEMAQMDNSKPHNLRNLEIFGENLLRNVTKRWNVNTFKLEELPNKVTNEANLKRYIHKHTHTVGLQLEIKIGVGQLHIS